MLKSIKSNYYMAGAAFTMGLIVSSEANAATMNDVFGTITGGLADFPKLVSVFSYLFGVVLVVLGVFKIKAHVESPQQNELKDGAIRLIAGGGLFSVPALTEAAQGFFSGGNAAQTNVTSVQW